MLSATDRSVSWRWQTPREASPMFLTIAIWLWLWGKRYKAAQKLLTIPESANSLWNTLKRIGQENMSITNFSSHPLFSWANHCDVQDVRRRMIVLFRYLSNPLCNTHSLNQNPILPGARNKSMAHPSIFYSLLEKSFGHEHYCTRVTHTRRHTRINTTLKRTHREFSFSVTLASAYPSLFSAKTRRDALNPIESLHRDSNSCGLIEPVAALCYEW